MKRYTTGAADRSIAMEARTRTAGAVADRKAMIESLESRQLLSAVTTDVAQPLLTVSAEAVNSSVVGYTASKVRAAYGITGTGAGQTIAIVDAYNDPNIAADLKAFDRAMGIADSVLSVVSQTGSTTALPTTDAGWAMETALDVEWAHAVAPGAKILLVEANSASFGDLLSAVNYARRSTGVSVVSMSWGASEFSGETSYDSYFTTPSGHTNVTFVAASGDDGYVTWPSVLASVLSVGGTALSLTTAGAYSSESGWSYSGGGYSRYVSEPTYQASTQSTGRRTTPDVSYDASPSTGFAVYDSVSYSGQSGWFQIGGTSAGAPQWAGLIALADAARAASGLASLATGSVLSALYSTYSSTSTYTSDFHDVTSGGSAGRGGKAATAGYDLVTGLGSPRAAGVISTLLNYAGTVASAVSSATTTTTPTAPTAPQPRQQRGGRFDVAEAEAPTVQIQPVSQASSVVIDVSDLRDLTAAAEARLGDNFVHDPDFVVSLSNASLESQGLAPRADEVRTEQRSSSALQQTARISQRSQPDPALQAILPGQGSNAVTLTTSAGLIEAHLVHDLSGFAKDISSAADPTVTVRGANDGTTAQVISDPTLSSSWVIAAAAATAGAAGFLWWWTSAEREQNEATERRANPFASSRLISAGPLY